MTTSTTTPNADPRKASAWTGGLYSVVRVLLGLWWLATAVPMLMRWEPSASVDEMVAWPWMIVRFVCPVLLVLGKGDRVAALLLAATASNDGLYVLAPLLLHAFTPRHPYGSWPARGRVDPAGDWRLSRDWTTVALLLLAATSTVNALNQLEIARWMGADMLAARSRDAWFLDQLPMLETPYLVVWFAIHLSFLPVVLAAPRYTKCVWTLSFVLLAFSGALGWSGLLLYLFAFDPAWVPASARPAPIGEPSEPETVFYDGECGLCHRAVRFLLSEDREGRFAFAPLQGETFQKHAAEAKRHGDTMFLALPDGTLLARSNAWIAIMRGLGGGWRVLGEDVALVPRPLRDLVYDAVARVRKGLFAKPDDACPLMPGHMVERYKV